MTLTRWQRDTLWSFPKQRWIDLDDAALQKMIVFAKRVAARIKAVTGCKKVAVVVLGLEVPHAHIHLIPINSEDDVDFRKPKLKLASEEFEKIAQSLQMKE